MSFPELLPSEPGAAEPRFATRTVDCWECGGSGEGGAGRSALPPWQAAREEVRHRDPRLSRAVRRRAATEGAR